MVKNNKIPEMTAVLQLMQDINNRKVSFERWASPKMINPVLPPTTHPATTFPVISLPIPKSFAPISPSPISSTPNLYLLNRPWCNLCDDYHEEKTCEVMKESKERISGKKQAYIVNKSSINSLKFEDEEVHVFNTRENNYNTKPPNGIYNKNNSNSLSTPKETILEKYNKEVTIPNGNPKPQYLVSTPTSSKKYNIGEELGQIKSSVTLLDLEKKNSSK